MLAKYRSCRKPSILFVALVVALVSHRPAQAQTRAKAQSHFHNDDVSISVFGQFTNSSNGDGVSVNPLDSVGGQATFRHVYHPWLGYEAGYGYTRFTDRYSSYPFAVQHNLHEFQGSYLFSGPLNLHLVQPFGLVGVSALLFAPTLNGGQNASAQARVAISFGGGANIPLLASRFGMRLQYRGLYYQTPDYGEAIYKTGTWRLTSEPAVGVYMKF